MTNPIVIVNVTQTIAPTPNQLQKRGALISQGGTTLAAGTYSLLTQFSDLTPLLAAPLAITSMSFSGAYGGQVTVTTTANHGIATNEQFPTVIAGVIPAAYNGTFMATSTGVNTFTYYLPGSNPGSVTTQGTYTPRNTAELISMAETFFAQGSQLGVYVLELGAGEPSAGATALQSFIQSTTQFFYSYLVPRNWDGNATFLALIATLQSTTAKTYFFITTTVPTYTVYTSVMKNVFAFVEAPIYQAWPANILTNVTWSNGEATATTTSAHGVNPGDLFTISGCTPIGYNGSFIALPGTTGSTLIYAVANNPGNISVEGTLVGSTFTSAGVPATEFSLAAPFWVSLHYDPSVTNKVTPMNYSFLTDVTQFPSLGNAALTTTLQNSFINFVGFGGEGGISENILIGGKTRDGNPFNYWYSVDWMQINVDLAISNAIINGSNNPINPLYYNQDGINRLEQVAAGVGATAVSVGLAVGQVKQIGLDGPTFLANLNAGDYDGMVLVNAIPLVPYLTTNPGDYAIGKYAGMSMVYTPLRGFDQIIFNINVTNFVAG